MNVVKPERLRNGDTVSIVSPSGGVPDELSHQFSKGVKFLESLGLKVRIGRNALKRFYYSAGTVSERLDDIHEAFSDKEVKALVMSIGGASANHLLDGLDFDLIGNNPKIFCGISDGTTLLNPILSKSGLITYHGPDVVFTFGLPMSAIIRDNLTNTLFDGTVGELRQNADWEGLAELNRDEECRGWHCIRSGKATGQLIGGNVNCLLSLENTVFRPGYDDSILFLEAYMTTVEGLHQAFVHFRQSGIFGAINGLILGHFYGSHMKDKQQDRELAEIVLEVTKDYSFPILEIGELGHNVENYILPIGCMATIDADNKCFTIDEQTVL